MGILFWIIFWGIIGIIWERIKASWRERNFIITIIWVIVTFIFVSIFGIIREHTMQQRREEWRKEFQSSSIKYEPFGEKIVFKSAIIYVG